MFIRTVMVLLFLTVFPMKSQAAGRSPEFNDGLYGYVEDEKGLPVSEADIGLFDGFDLQRSQSDSKGTFRIAKPSVSPGRFVVLYFTNKGYIPQAINIKMPAAGALKISVILKRTTNQKSAFIIGSVYKPIRGGKIEFQNGIYNFVKGCLVILERGSQIRKMETDEDGHFLFEVSGGNYVLSVEGGREKVETGADEGETAIQNLRSGIILVD